MRRLPNYRPAISRGQSMPNVLLSTTVALAALVAPSVAAAQNAVSVPPTPTPPAAPTTALANNSRTSTYDAAFFTQYAPRSALDVARHVPGFSLDLGNNDVRGFAGAA